MDRSDKFVVVFAFICLGIIAPFGLWVHSTDQGVIVRLEYVDGSVTEVYSKHRNSDWDWDDITYMRISGKKYPLGSVKTVSYRRPSDENH